eukprot:scaffold2031_cov179-Ochromonas_danica.AAC.3
MGRVTLPDPSELLCFAVVEACAPLSVSLTKGGQKKCRTLAKMKSSTKQQKRSSRGLRTWSPTVLLASPEHA